MQFSLAMPVLPDRPADAGSASAPSAAAYLLNAFGARMPRRRYRPGERIVREGAADRELYVIVSGTAEVLKGDEAFPMARLQAGDHFGAMALIDGAARSATVRAVTPLEVAVLTPELLDAPTEAGTPGREVLLQALLIDQNAHLRNATQHAAEVMRRELEAARARVALGQFVTYVVVGLSLYSFVVRLMANVQGADMAFYTIVSMCVLAFFVALVLVFMRRSGYSMELYGLTFRGAGASVRDALLWTAGFLAVLTGVKWGLLQGVPALAGAPLFSFTLLEVARPEAVLADAALYALYSPAQELVARGALQGSLQHLLTGRHVTARAIFISSILFMATHLHLGIGYAVATLLPSFFWGFLFARERNLAGVSVSHVLIGWYALYVLGFPGLDLYG